MRDYKLCVQNLSTYSKGANIFVLIHKMDKINESERKKVRSIALFTLGLRKKEKRDRRCHSCPVNEHQGSLCYLHLGRHSL